jgi:hypothetical protein
LDVSWLVRRLTDKLDKSSQSSDLYSSRMFWLNIIFACAYGSAGMGGGETVAGLTALNFAVSHSKSRYALFGLATLSCWCHQTPSTDEEEFTWQNEQNELRRFSRGWTFNLLWIYASKSRQHYPAIAKRSNGNWQA